MKHQPPADYGTLFSQPKEGHPSVSALREALTPIGDGKHPTHRMHENSRAAWRTLDMTGRKHDVLDLLDRHGAPMTDRAICTALGSQDMNYARPTVTHLIDEGVLREVDAIECPVTGRSVRRVWFVEDE